MKYRNIWVVLLSPASPAKTACFSLLRSGRKLADAKGENLIAVAIGKGAHVIAREAIHYGADNAIFVEETECELYSTEPFTHILTQLSKKHRPRAIIIEATENGRDLAPRVACRLKTGLSADCIEVQLNKETQAIEWICPAFGGALLATITCEKTRPEMGTMRPVPNSECEKDEQRTGTVIQECIQRNRHDCVTVEGFTPNIEAENSSVETSEVIVCGGRGLGTRENFHSLYPLAQLLGGSVAASRVPTEFGWVDDDIMVGHSGKMISPKLYIAFGISGAIQHTAGIASCDTFIAVNKDKSAPIFDVAHFGLVCDANKLLPALIDAISEIKERNTCE